MICYAIILSHITLTYIKLLPQAPVPPPTLALPSARGRAAAGANRSRAGRPKTGLQRTKLQVHSSKTLRRTSLIQGNPTRIEKRKSWISPTDSSPSACRILARKTPTSAPVVQSPRSSTCVYIYIYIYIYICMDV